MAARITLFDELESGPLRVEGVTQRPAARLPLRLDSPPVRIGLDCRTRVRADGALGLPVMARSVARKHRAMPGKWGHLLVRTHRKPT